MQADRAWIFDNSSDEPELLGYKVTDKETLEEWFNIVNLPLELLRRLN
jgi:predicted ABC-type ATPase